MSYDLRRLRLHGIIERIADLTLDKHILQEVLRKKP